MTSGNVEEAVLKPKKSYWGCYVSVALLVMAAFVCYFVPAILAQVTINNYYRLWTETSITDYSVTVQILDVEERVVSTHRQIVRDGLALSFVDRTPAIEQLFALARICAWQPLTRCDVVYHPLYSFPTKFVWVDMEPGLSLAQFEPE